MKNIGNYQHGGHTINRPEHNSWRAMKERCDNKNYRAYHRYGGRGIRYIERWSDFALFLEDMGKKPTPEHQLDRVDNEKDYAPENCKWSTSKQNNSNRANNRYITIDNVSNTISEWSRHYNISLSTIYNRLGYGWSPERAITTPANPPGKHIVIK